MTIPSQPLSPAPNLHQDDNPLPTSLPCVTQKMCPLLMHNLLSHRLAIHDRILFKLLLYVCKCSQGLAPNYSSDLLSSPLAEKVCAPPLINPFSVSTGLLVLPAQSFFLWLGRRNGTDYLNSTGNHLLHAIFKKNLKTYFSVSLVINPLLFCFSGFFALLLFNCTAL